MKEYTKPQLELIILSGDVIVTSGCRNDCGWADAIELPCQPGDN